MIDSLDSIDLISSYPSILTNKGRLDLAQGNIKIAKKLESPYKSSTGIVNKFVKGKLLFTDERNASKYGLKNIKGSLSKDIYKLEEQRQKAANDSYKSATKISYKLPLRNKIQIPSKRGEIVL